MYHILITIIHNYVNSALYRHTYSTYVHIHMHIHTPRHTYICMFVEPEMQINEIEISILHGIPMKI